MKRSLSSELISSYSSKEFLRTHKSTIIVGTLLRLIFAPITGHPYDLPIWMESGELISKGLSPYSPFDHLGQTIIWAVWTGFTYILSHNIRFGQPYLYIFLIKLLPIIADLLSLYMLIKILHEEGYDVRDLKYSKYVLILYLNPVLFFASSFWAMADSLALLFLLLAYRKIRDRYWKSSALFLSISIALKLYPVIYLPVFCLYIVFFKKSYIQSIGYASITILSFIFIAYIPFVLFPWDSNQITGVLLDQTNRNFGGLAPLGLLRFSDIYNPINGLHSMISAILGLLPYIWFFCLIGLSVYLLHRFTSSGNVFYHSSFRVFVMLIIIFSCVWMLTASWVSEQNYVILTIFLILKFITDSSRRELSESFKYIPALVISLVVLHIIFNVPFPLFFHVIYPNIANYGISEVIYYNNLILQIVIVTMSVILVFSTIHVTKNLFHRPFP